MAINTDYDAVKNVMDKYGIPAYIWQPIAQLESGWNRYAVAETPKEKSIGLFQINLKAHPEYTAWDLTNPAQNAEAIARIWTGRGVVEKALQMPTYEQAAYVWRYGSRPAWSTDLENRINQESLKYLISGYDSSFFYSSDGLELGGGGGGARGIEEGLSLSWGERLARGGAWLFLLIVMVIALTQLFTGEIPDIKKVVKKWKS